MYAIDKRLNLYESTSMKFSIIPVVGTVLGSAKIITGALQFITAFILTVLLALPLLAAGQKKAVKWIASHLTHGLANILGGVIEAIPIIGSINAIVRVETTKKDNPSPSHHPYFKIMGYKTVAEKLYRQYPGFTITYLLTV